MSLTMLKTDNIITKDAVFNSPLFLRMSRGFQWGSNIYHYLKHHLSFLICISNPSRIHIGIVGSFQLFTDLHFKSQCIYLDGWMVYFVIWSVISAILLLLLLLLLFLIRGRESNIYKILWNFILALLLFGLAWI